MNFISRIFSKQIKTPSERRIIDDHLKMIAPYTLCRESKLLSLIQLADDIEKRGIMGDFVECGTFKGGAAAFIAAHLKPYRNVWLYDSFEGMPEVTSKDGEEAHQWVGDCVASMADVEEVLSKMKITADRVTIRKGWFEDTFKKSTPSEIAFLHIDADWYESVKLTLETFYDKVRDGGVIVLDDFGHWEGCREAFYDFCNERGIKPLLERFENDQAFWFKGRLHNRDGWSHQPAKPIA
jgi:O-methyltransferase